MTTPTVKYLIYSGQLDLLQDSIISSGWDGKAHFAGEHAVNAALLVNESPLPTLN